MVSEADKFIALRRVSRGLDRLLEERLQVHKGFFSWKVNNAEYDKLEAIIHQNDILFREVLGEDWDSDDNFVINTQCFDKASEFSYNAFQKYLLKTKNCNAKYFCTRHNLSIRIIQFEKLKPYFFKKVVVALGCRPSDITFKEDVKNYVKYQQKVVKRVYMRWEKISPRSEHYGDVKYVEHIKQRKGGE